MSTLAAEPTLQLFRKLGGISHAAGVVIRTTTKRAEDESEVEREILDLIQGIIPQIDDFVGSMEDTKFKLPELQALHDLTAAIIDKHREIDRLAATRKTTPALRRASAALSRGVKKLEGVLELLHDSIDAEEALAKHNASGEKAIPWEDVKRRLGL